ncbi:hypothetical protein F7725_004533, partial [Dissostichus mawsoni]
MSSLRAIWTPFGSPSIRTRPLRSESWGIRTDTLYCSLIRLTVVLDDLLYLGLSLFHLLCRTLQTDALLSVCELYLLCDAPDVLSFLADDVAMQPGRGAYTCVSAGPNLSGSPLRMMVSDPESRGGISTETPVVSRISCRGETGRRDVSGKEEGQMWHSEGWMGSQQETGRGMTARKDGQMN